MANIVEFFHSRIVAFFTDKEYLTRIARCANIVLVLSLTTQENIVEK